MIKKLEQAKENIKNFTYPFEKGVEKEYLRLLNYRLKHYKFLDNFIFEEERQKALIELEKVYVKYTKGWLRYYKMINDCKTIKNIKIVMESLTSDFMMKESYSYESDEDSDNEYLI